MFAVKSTSQPLSRSSGLVLQSAAVALASLASPALMAQDARPGALSISPSMTLTETWTDNVRPLAPVKESDLVSQLTASLRLASHSGRVQGNLDYSLDGYNYARGTYANHIRNTLQAQGRANVIDNWFSIDANANIGQQAISSLGAQTVDAGLVNPNQAEVRSVLITPSIHGSFNSYADYRASVSYGLIRGGISNGRGDVNTLSSAISVGSPQGAKLGWQASLNRSHTDYLETGGRATDDQIARLSLNYSPMPDLQLTASAGVESGNLISANRQSNSIWGFGATWSPASNIRVAAHVDRRFFGNGYLLDLEYRLPKSSIRLSTSRDVSNPGQSSSIGTYSTAYDLLNGQFATSIPDPVLRDLQIRSYLQNYGISPTAAVQTGFLPSAMTLQRRTELAYSLQGVRSNMTVSAASTISSRLDQAATTTDDLSGGNQLHQASLIFSLGHRLTPLSGISLNLSQLHTSGSLGSQATTLRSAQLNFTTSLGPRSSASLAARHVQFDSTVPFNSYSENALIATFGHRF